jgi:tetratricopeptide (TPR) repeat protein
VEVYHNIALVYRELKDYSKTVAYLKMAVETNPEHIQSYQVLGELYYEDRQFKLAIEMFEKMLLIDNSNYLGYYWVALAYDARRKYPEAIEAYEMFIKIAPEEYYEQKVRMYDRAERLKRWLEKKKKN